MRSRIAGDRQVNMGARTYRAVADALVAEGAAGRFLRRRVPRFRVGLRR